MLGQAQGSSDYSMATTILDMWATYRTPVMIAFVIALVLAIIFFLLKHSAGKWFLFLAFFLGISFVALDGFKIYVHKRTKEAIVGVITSPVKTVGKTLKGIFGFGQ